MTWTFENFTRGEFACACCDKSEMDLDFVAALQRIRTEFGKAMPITSGYRCALHNSNVSSTGLRGPHVTGKAADIAVMGEDAQDRKSTRLNSSHVRTSRMPSSA